MLIHHIDKTASGASRNSFPPRDAGGALLFQPVSLQAPLAHRIYPPTSAHQLRVETNENNNNEKPPFLLQEKEYQALLLVLMLYCFGDIRCFATSLLWGA